jgi:hypothetical protein
MNTSYPEGIDIVWLAADGSGNVGTFVTGGSGPIPSDVLNSKNGPLEDVEELLCDVPRISEAHLLVNVKRPDDFVAMAERGFYVYDWSDVHRTAREAIGGYELVAEPLSPLSTQHIDSKIAAALRGIKLKDASFPEMRVLDVRKHLACREADRVRPTRRSSHE